MGWWPFGRRSTVDKSVETLLAEAEASSPDPAAPPTVAQPGDGSFRLPVEDVFMITGRGVVVTGRVESGSAAVGMQVSVVRDGVVVATSRINGIEKFRAVIETATVGDNVGLLLDAMTKDQLQHGDVVTG